MSEQIMLDWCGARANRDNGMNVSILNAESRQSDWGKRAYAILEEFVFHSSGEFMAEDVREYAKRNKSIEEPP